MGGKEEERTKRNRLGKKAADKRQWPVFIKKKKTPRNKEQEGIENATANKINCADGVSMRGKSSAQKPDGQNTRSITDGKRGIVGGQRGTRGRKKHRKSIRREELHRNTHYRRKTKEGANADVNHRQSRGSGGGGKGPGREKNQPHGGKTQR